MAIAAYVRKEIVIGSLSATLNVSPVLLACLRERKYPSNSSTVQASGNGNIPVIGDGDDSKKKKDRNEFLEIISFDRTRRRFYSFFIWKKYLDKSGIYGMCYFESISKNKRELCN